MDRERQEPENDILVFDERSSLISSCRGGGYRPHRALGPPRHGSRDAN